MNHTYAKRLATIAALALLVGACSSPSGSEEAGDTEKEPPTNDVWEPDVVDVFSSYDSGSGSGGGSEETGSTDADSDDSGMRTDAPQGDADAGPPCDRVTFEYTNASAESVWVTGTFNDWAPTHDDGALEMTASDGTWSRTTQIRDRGRHYYKFIVDGNEWVPDPTNGRQVSDHLGGRRSVVDVCRPEPAPDCGTVNFAYRDGSASEVKLAGDFTEWDENPVAMREIDGVWRGTVDLEPGPHQYKFIVDGTWKTDPENDETVMDGQGGMNSLVAVECPGG